jgi:hypothetical protein
LILKEVGLSEKAMEAVRSKYKRPELFNSTFKFDLAEFSATLPYRSVELDNGGMMIASASEFNDIFPSESVGGSPTRRRFTTEGDVVDARFRKTK